jgi:hypothetical protein
LGGFGEGRRVGFRLEIGKNLFGIGKKFAYDWI